MDLRAVLRACHGLGLTRSWTSWTTDGQGLMRLRACHYSPNLSQYKRVNTDFIGSNQLYLFRKTNIFIQVTSAFPAYFYLALGKNKPKMPHLFCL